MQVVWMTKMVMVVVAPISTTLHYILAGYGDDIAAVVVDYYDSHRAL